ncbi:hypothetical protein [Bradyrhizobium sp. JYMT SZCCT0428]|uniref:hypothetical protein n=1 Tax=Bradyrhizobium sp. JYMT SZCCT0428 TaxID=2807673 RepID=UPI001BA6A029|nr:hypothetical protein [Bradyrhizobium sp. JYMT SZCCT0428]
MKQNACPAVSRSWRAGDLMSKRFVSKRFGIGLLFACVTALLLPVLVVVVDMIFLHQTMINSIYKNVEDISDATEMPTTVTSFQSGPDVVSTIGGSGDGLNCSLPGLANMFFHGMKNRHGQSALVLQRFRQACVFHDLCYRHGLATYGYNQNDCDRVLQNAALRLCYVWNPLEGKARCQTESKMVLAGVSLGGSDAYRAWDRSTYFEFESDPWRSNGFSVSRVVDHPFKSVDREKYRDEPDQVILNFDNVRSNLTVTCVTCKQVPVLREKTSDRYDTTEELRSVGITQLPDALLQHTGQQLSDTSPVWLPPRRRHAAPHLLVDSTGKNHLIWVTRNNPGDTISCIVLADTARLLTYTLPKRDNCSSDAASQLTMVEVDMFATSPLVMELPASKESIFAIALSVSREDDGSLSFCSRSASRNVDRPPMKKDDDKADCIPIDKSVVRNGAGLGAFQNFAIIRPGQQILFARDIVTSPASLWTRISRSLRGIKYSPDGVMLVIDVTAASAEKGSVKPRLKKAVRFKIEDRLDPMMPISRNIDDLRFLGLENTENQVSVRMIDFAKENPAVGDVKLEMNKTEVNLHPSWASRPLLVLETRGPNPKTRLVFSRGAIAVDPHKPLDNESEIVESPNLPFDGTKPQTESLALETLIFERDATPSSDKPFVKKSAVACVVKYTFRRHEEFPCYRSFDPKRPMRSSPAARMQASQLLVGHFAGRGGYGIAFPEYCESGPPIILRQNEDGTLVPEKSLVGAAGTFTRQVTCDPLDSNEYVSGPIKSTPDMTISAADWPYQP